LRFNKPHNFKMKTLAIIIAAFTFGALVAVPAFAQEEYAVKVVPMQLRLKVGQTRSIHAEAKGNWRKIEVVDHCSTSFFEPETKNYITIDRSTPKYSSESVALTLVVTGKTPGECLMIFRVVDRRGDSGGQTHMYIKISK
jgi:hypothetical protein